MQLEAKTWRKKPVEVQAIQFDGSRTSMYTILAWISENGGRAQIGDGYPTQGPDTIDILTLEGIMKALPNDYVIRGVNGEFYPCKPDIFEKTYEDPDAG